MVRLRPVWMTNHRPSVLWHCWLGHQTCKNRRPYNLYCVGADVKPCSINYRCRCNWTQWFNGGVHIPHDVIRHRNETDAEIELGSISASVSHNVVRCRAQCEHRFRLWRIWRMFSLDVGTRIHAKFIICFVQWLNLCDWMTAASTASAWTIGLVQ